VNDKHLILIKYVWIIFMLLFFFSVQVLFNKDRFFWLALLSPVIEGNAQVVELSREKRQLNYYTINIKGIGDTPDFVVIDQWGHDYYRLDNIYAILLTEEQNTMVKVHWKKPWFKDAFYVAIQGNKEITKPIFSYSWLFLSAFPLLLLFVAFRLRIFK